MELFDLYCVVLGRAMLGLAALMATALAAYIGIMSAEAISMKRKRVRK